MCDKYMYTMSEGAWKSVTSHVSRDTAATIRQAGLHSLTADRANLHFTHNIHVHVYNTYTRICTCAYTHYGYYTEMVVELVKAKGDRKRGCACTCTCSVYCPHTLCMCIHIFCTVVCHTTHTNL